MGCESVFDAIKPMRMLCKVFGFQLYTVVQRDGLYHLRTSFLDVLCFIYSLVGFSIFCGLNVQYDFFEGHHSSHTVDMATRFLVIFGFGLQVVGIFVNIINRRKVFQLQQILHRFDTILSFHHVDVNHTRHYRIILGTIVGVLCLFTALGVTSVYVHGDLAKKFFLTHIFYHIATISYTAFMLQFIFMLMVVRWRYAILNDAFRKRFGLDVVQKVVVAKVGALKLFWHDDTAFISDLAILYDLLTDSVGLLNSCFSLQAMPWFAATFCLNVLGFFTLYRFIIQGRWESLTESIIYAMWLCYDISFIICSIMEGDNIAREGRITAVLIHKAINRNFDSPPLTEKLQLVSQQLIHRHPEVSCGLFTFNWPYLASTVGAIAMYLCILIQFDMAEPH